MIWLGWLVSNALAMPCDTVQRLKTAPPFPVFEQDVVRGDTKLEQDAFGTYSNVLQSENFILKWGGNAPDFDPDRILADFESNWSQMYIGWEHAAPVATEDFLFNVYIGNSGDSTPVIEGSLAYYTRDVRGYPMIVISPESLALPEGEVAAILAHEFYHAIQDAESAFGYTDEGAWIWESTSNWAAHQMYPNATLPLESIPFYLRFSEKSLNFFKYPEDGIDEEFYQYGSVLFPLHVTATLGDPGIVPEVWKRGSFGDDPIDIYREVLAERDVDFNEIWMEHNVGAVVLDYEFGQAVENAINAYAPNWYTTSVNMTGTPLVESDATQPLEDYGFHVIELDVPSKSIFRVQVSADPIGSMNTIGYFESTILYQKDGVFTEYPLDMDDWFGEMRFSDVGPLDRIYIVIGVWVDRPLSGYYDDESFRYSYAIEGLDPPEIFDSDIEDDTPREINIDVWGLLCGCSAIDPVSASAWIWCVFFYWRRRRAT